MAASTQADAANNSTAAQQQMYQQTAANEAPYRSAGSAATSELQYLLGIGPDPSAQSYAPVTGGSGGGYSNTMYSDGVPARFFAGGGAAGDRGGGRMTNGGNAATGTHSGGYGSLLKQFDINTFHQMSPAYRFGLQQGQQGVLNGEEANMGALSGAAQKDLMAFNQGYADNAFNNAFNQYQTQQGNIYQRLGGLAQLGQAAASNQATGASSFANGIGQSMTNAGTAAAGGIVGATNSITGSINSALPYLYSPGSSSAGSLNATPASSVLGPDAAGYTVYAPSDRRLKRNIRRIGATPGGQAWYEFDYIWGQHAQGVMADESPPEAVAVGANGFMMVDYSRIV
jgi:hypothetical protein